MLENPQMPKMRRGVVAMFDALGWKGIWARPEVRDDPYRVVAKMQVLRDLTKEDWAKRLGFDDGLPTDVRVIKGWHVTFISDTIVLALEPTREADWAAEPLLPVMSSFAATVLRQGVGVSPGLAYRGCISVGEFLMEDEFILGPAIDEAAEFMNVAEGAFVWFADSAEQVQRRFDDLAVSAGEQKPLDFPKEFVRNMLLHAHNNFVPYHVPMKEGEPRDTYVVHPFTVRSDAQQRERLLRKVLATFGTNPKFESKRKNTEAFLRHASARVEAYDEFLRNQTASLAERQ